MKESRNERIIILKKATAEARSRFYAALSMLLIASLMVTGSSFAWLTMSAAPEAVGIETSIAGNGALDIALMPQNGLFSDIGSGVGMSGMFAGGSASSAVANNSWGNLIDLKNDVYGLKDVRFRPLQMVSENGMLSGFSNPLWGFDGRIAQLDRSAFRSHYINGSFDLISGFRGNCYGVRAIVDSENDTYGYVVDLAFILNSAKDENTNGKLLLQREGVQRIYSDGYSEATQGGGSYLRFRDRDGAERNDSAAAAFAEVLRLTFVQDLGNGAAEGARDCDCTCGRAAAAGAGTGAAASPTSSRTAPPSQQTTGVPQAIASSRGKLKPS